MGAMNNTITHVGAADKSGLRHRQSEPTGTAPGLDHEAAISCRFTRRLGHRRPSRVNTGRDLGCVLRRSSLGGGTHSSNPRLGTAGPGGGARYACRARLAKWVTCAELTVRFRSFFGISRSKRTIVCSSRKSILVRFRCQKNNSAVAVDRRLPIIRILNPASRSAHFGASERHGVFYSRAAISNLLPGPERFLPLRRLIFDNSVVISFELF